jgi:hypothetical protein
LILETIRIRERHESNAVRGRKTKNLHYLWKGTILFESGARLVVNEMLLTVQKKKN